MSFLMKCEITENNFALVHEITMDKLNGRFFCCQNIFSTLKMLKWLSCDAAHFNTHVVIYNP